MVDHTPHFSVLDAPHDAELIADSLEGDIRAFSLLVAKYQGQVFAEVLKICPHAEHARRIVQETFVMAWRDLWLLECSEGLESWLCCMARERARTVTSTGILLPN